MDLLTPLLIVASAGCVTASSSSAATSSASSAANGNSTTAGGHSGAHVHASAQEIGFLTICIFLGVVSRKCIEPKIFMHFVPYTVILLGGGVLIGAVSIYTQFDDSKGEYGEINRFCHMSPAELVENNYPTSYGCSANLSSNHCACLDAWGTAKVNILHNLSPHVILFVFLPPLIFESAFFMDFHIFVRSIVGVSMKFVQLVSITFCVFAPFFPIYLSQRPDFFRKNLPASQDFIPSCTWGDHCHIRHRILFDDRCLKLRDQRRLFSAC